METERAIRRNVANLNERRRMHSINDGFDVLRNYLPGQGRENLSKAAVLQQTAELVAQLLEERNAVANNDTYGVVKQDRDEMPVLIPQVRVPPGLESIPSIKRKVSKGTGNILQDLISSTVHVEKYAVPPNQIDQIRKIRTVEEIAKCSICLTEGKVLPLASPELEIFIDLAKNEMSFALFSWTLCCSSCQSTLQKLTKLQNEIDNIKMFSETFQVINHLEFHSAPPSPDHTELVDPLEDVCPQEEDKIDFLNLNQEDSNDDDFLEDSEDINEDIDVKPLLVGTEVDVDSDMPIIIKNCVSISSQSVLENLVGSDDSGNQNSKR
ncbi:Helix-loop-helix protein 11 [Folsomia candida]|uniref:Helix-loop-helix protein 11 n=1 Tax=Folsomia candida TaxID=158441 RepID=A0A226D1Y4_FOLCA|nr:Helix-loop-helix protein 11 [Folsomia candida]